PRNCTRSVVMSPSVRENRSIGSSWCRWLACTTLEDAAMRIRGRLVLFLIAIVSLTGAAPPPPDVYDVEVRYKIDGFGVNRISQYYDLTGFARGLGFKRLGDPSAKEEAAIEEDEREDPRHPPLKGTISSANARKLLGERHVQIIRLMPANAKAP